MLYLLILSNCFLPLVLGSGLVISDDEQTSTSTVELTTAVTLINSNLTRKDLFWEYHQFGLQTRKLNALFCRNNFTEEELGNNEKCKFNQRQLKAPWFIACQNETFGPDASEVQKHLQFCTDLQHVTRKWQLCLKNRRRKHRKRPKRHSRGIDWRQLTDNDWNKLPEDQRFELLRKANLHLQKKKAALECKTKALNLNDL